MKNSKEINFEFTPSGTPQKNDAIERGFATLYSRMGEMMACMGLHEKLKTGILPECTETMNKLEKYSQPARRKMCLR